MGHVLWSQFLFESFALHPGELFTVCSVGGDIVGFALGVAAFLSVVFHGFFDGGFVCACEVCLFFGAGGEGIATHGGDGDGGENFLHAGGGFIVEWVVWVDGFGVSGDVDGVIADGDEARGDGFDAVAFHDIGVDHVVGEDEQSDVFVVGVSEDIFNIAPCFLFEDVACIFDAGWVVVESEDVDADGHGGYFLMRMGWVRRGWGCIWVLRVLCVG